MIEGLRHRLVVAVSCIVALLSSSLAAQAPPEAKQGEAWTSSLRERYYSLDQGSRLIPLAWLKALQQADGTPFAANHLERYGFLPDWGDADRLAVGITIAAAPGGRVVGFTCAACHTREIEARGRALRIEGAPALVDFQRFLIDLDQSVRIVLSDDARFRSFADKVVGAKAVDRDVLLYAVRLWSLRFHAYVTALPLQPWGPGRLDAFGLIFNQLAGLDVGNSPSHLIAENIVSADAPVRFPFLWNSSFQDKTDWPGFADNGDDRAALARNISEALGVFATFHPKASPSCAPLNRDYLADNSEDPANLRQLEADVVALKPPVWPWEIDAGLAAKGRVVFDRAKEQGGCVECHGMKPGVHRGSRPTFATPVLDVGTDTRMWLRLARTVHTGAMTGAAIPGLPPLQETDAAARLLIISVVGILEQASTSKRARPHSSAADAATTVGKRTIGPATPSEKAIAPNSYEARVLSGIWAAAPYLHDGSVPTMADLLKVSSQRPLRFSVGRNYDVAKVGLAQAQAPGSYVFSATGCDVIDSGSSNCGHEYGTMLPEADKRALLEYLKTL